MRKAMIFTAAFAMTAVSATTVSAKSSLHLSTNKVSTSSKYISGKATPHTKITMTRYGMVYAKGTSSKHGTFKIRLRSVLSSGWKYRMTASKKGYSVKKMYVSVPKKSVSTGVDTTPYPIESNPNTNHSTVSTPSDSAQVPVIQSGSTASNSSNTSQNNSDGSIVDPTTGLTKDQEAQIQEQLDALTSQMQDLDRQAQPYNEQAATDMRKALQDEDDMNWLSPGKKELLENLIKNSEKRISEDKANNDLLAEQNDQANLDDQQKNLDSLNRVLASGVTMDQLKADKLQMQNDSVIQSQKAKGYTDQKEALYKQRQALGKQLNEDY